MGSVYRILGRGGSVLYVGSTTRDNVARRWVEHMSGQPWAHEVIACEIVAKDVPERLLAAVERVIAQCEEPRHGNWAQSAPLVAAREKPAIPSARQKPVILGGIRLIDKDILAGIEAVGIDVDAVVQFAHRNHDQPMMPRVKEIWETWQAVAHKPGPRRALLRTLAGALSVPESWILQDAVA